MSYTISITEDQVFTALRNWLLYAVSGEVVQGIVNRVAMPAGGFVEMTPLVKTRLSTNVTSYPDINTETNQQFIDFTIQLDIYGANAGDWSTIITTAFRSDQACAFLAAQLPGIAPLYSEAARQLPLINGEEQYESHWSIAIHLQFNPSVNDTQQSANVITPAIINVDATYPL
jgi:hypothetical protein